MAEPSVSELKEILVGLEALDYRRTYQQFYDFRPYPRQKDFLDAGSAFSERLLIAGKSERQKTYVGAFEAACHMTGIYPDDWQGRRFAKATRGWIAGQTSLVLATTSRAAAGNRGVEDAFGTGMIPKDLFLDKLARLAALPMPMTRSRSGMSPAE